MSGVILGTSGCGVLTTSGGDATSGFLDVRRPETNVSTERKLPEFVLESRSNYTLCCTKLSTVTESAFSVVKM